MALYFMPQGCLNVYVIAIIYHAYVDSFFVDLQVDDLFPGFEDPQFPEPDVEGRGEVGAVGLFHDNHVDCARQSRSVDLAVPVPDGPGQGGEDC